MNRFRRVLFSLSGLSPVIAVGAIIICFQMERDLRAMREIFNENIVIQDRINHTFEAELNDQLKNTNTNFANILAGKKEVRLRTITYYRKDAPK